MVAHERPATHLVAHIADEHVHLLRCALVLVGPLPVDQRKLDSELVGDRSHAVGRHCAQDCPRGHEREMRSPFCAAGVRADNDGVLPVRDAALDVRDHKRFRVEVVDREVEEALDLAGVQVHRNHVVAPRDGEHVRHQLGRNRRPRLVLLVHPGVGIAWDDRRNPTRGRTLAGRDENEQLHQVVVYVAAARLDDEDVLISDGL
jgi:hypothetical protein